VHSQLDNWARLAMNWEMPSLTRRISRRIASASFNLKSAIAFLLALCLSGCETASLGPTTASDAAARAALVQSIANEPPGDYWIGRRYYNANYKFWGYIRRPRQSWKEAKLVVLNENSKYAPDRALNNVGIDNNSEYRIKGRFTGDIIYESASN